MFASEALFWDSLYHRTKKTSTMATIIDFNARILSNKMGYYFRADTDILIDTDFSSIQN